MKPTLIFQAPVATRSGYGDHARDLLHSLYKLDKFEIKVISTRWGQTPMDALNYDKPFHKWVVDNIIPKIDQKPDIYIQVTVPNEFQPIGHYNIGITAAIETTHSPLDWVHGCNRMDLIIVPSEHSKKSLVDSIYNETNPQGQLVAQHKIQKPIEVLFEGFDENDFGTDEVTYIEQLNQIKEDFAFLFVGHWLRGDLGEDRKNVGMMIKTFAMAFKNEKVKPALILKTSTAGFSIMDRERLVSKIRETLGKDYKSVPVYLLHGDLTSAQMNGLYEHPKVKAMINFTKGEGFGRPLLEFSMTGKPILASNWSGHKDFLPIDKAVLIGGNLTDVHQSSQDKFIINGSKWFTANYDEFIAVMKLVYEKYDEFTEKSKSLKNDNMENFSSEKMKEKFESILKNYIIKPTEKKLVLPQLKKIS